MASDLHKHAEAFAIDSGLHNPFESTFSLLRSLRDEIHDLKREVADLRAQKRERFERLESDVAKLSQHTSDRFDKVAQELDDIKGNTNNRFDKMAQAVDDLRKQNADRLDQLSAQVRAEMKLRFDQNMELDKRLREELKKLRCDLEKTSSELFRFEQKTTQDIGANKTSCDELRQDVEKLAALLSVNSMAKDPFNQLGYRCPSPSTPVSPLGSTARGSNLPPLGQSPNSTTAWSGSPLSAHTCGM